MPAARLASPAHSGSPRRAFSLGGDESAPLSPSSAPAERVDSLRKLMLIILDDVMSWVRVVESESEVVRTDEDIARMREDCISLMQIKNVR
jgi:hypothetical protein